ERGETVDREAGERSDEGQRDTEGVRAKADRKHAAFAADAAGGRVIAEEAAIVRRVKKDTRESDGDEEPAQPVDDERRRGAVLREDVLTDQRRWERDDPDGD